MRLHSEDMHGGGLLILTKTPVKNDSLINNVSIGEINLFSILSKLHGMLNGPTDFPFFS